MPDLPDLVSDGKIRAEAVDGLDGLDWARALGDANSPAAQLAAVAIAAGAKRAQAARDALVALLARDDVAGRASAWALAQLDSEAQVLAAIRGGRIDARDNGYWSLAIRAAAGRASPTLAAAASELVVSEVERAKGGATGLGDRASRVLAILGAKDAAERIQQVLDADRFADRFELQRQSKAVQDGRRDGDSIAELTAPWRTLFADHLVAPPAAPAAAPAPAPQAKPVAKAPTPPAAKPPAGFAVKQPPPAAPLDDAGDEAADGVADGEAGEAPLAQPVDWKAFATSPEATALPPAVRTLIGQLGPLLEQLAVRAINAPLTDLAGQEFAALLLQVLPQALPQQHVQMALSPQALNGYQALTKFLARTNGATHGDELVQAVKLVRQQLQQQIRQSGILGGPDYSDPDEAPTPAPAST